MNPIIAIIGRPNVGKSTLFNRICGKRLAIVEEMPGVTRDRNYQDIDWNGRRLTVVDTGGFEPSAEDDIQEMVRQQTLLAIEEADALIMLFDGRDGLTPSDVETVDMLRRIPKPVYYAVNKVDGIPQEEALADFHRLGVDRFYPISAIHGIGISELLDTILAGIPEEGDSQTKEEGIKVAVVGRPNVGKSSLINRLCGHPRLLVHESPGTTRDAIDTRIEKGEKIYTLIDTAGIRRKGKTREALEKYCVFRALRSLQRCDVALVLIDATEGITDQDAHIAGYAIENGRACILIVNKWDLVKKDSSTMGEYVRALRSRLKFMEFSPIAFISALTGHRVQRIWPLVELAYEQYRKRIETSALNRRLASWVEEHPPPLSRNKRVKLYYATQVSTMPPAFTIFTNDPDGIHFSYRRYLVNRIRDDFGFQAVPIRIFFKERRKRGRGRKV